MKKSLRKLFMYRIICYILNADDTELNKIIDAVNQRYPRLHPDWDVVYLALPKDDKEKRRQLFLRAFSVISEE